MSIIVQPIITASCMACTIPFDNSTSYEKFELYKNDTITYKKNYKKFIIYNSEAKSLSTNRLHNMNNNYNYMSKAVSKYRPMKISKKIRKNHFIHQPGRTNCTQRYQK